MEILFNYKKKTILINNYKIVIAAFYVLDFSSRIKYSEKLIIKIFSICKLELEDIYFVQMSKIDFTKTTHILWPLYKLTRSCHLLGIVDVDKEQVVDSTPVNQNFTEDKRRGKKAVVGVTYYSYAGGSPQEDG